MRSSLSILLASIGMTSLVVNSVFAQTPTEAQQQAIRSNCVADFRANCSEVQPHGTAALVCLEQHESKLSPACKSAVDAIGGGSSTAASSTAESSAPATSSASSATNTASAAKSEDSTAATTADKTAKAPAAAPAAAQAVSGVPEMSFRQEMRIAAHACARDFRLLCPNLPVGHGNVLFCLKVHGPRLDPPCRSALTAAGVEF